MNQLEKIMTHFEWKMFVVQVKKVHAQNPFEGHGVMRGPVHALIGVVFHTPLMGLREDASVPIIIPILGKCAVGLHFEIDKLGNRTNCKSSKVEI